MNTSRKLKIWTLILHAFILIGAGHGIAPLLALEVMGFPYITNTSFSLSLSAPFKSRICMVGLTTLLGQALLIGSILVSSRKGKIATHIAGLLLLWLSIVYFNVEYPGDPEVHFAGLTAVPFAVCTILVFIGRAGKKDMQQV